MKNKIIKEKTTKMEERRNEGIPSKLDATDGASSYIENNRFDDIFSGIVLRSNNWRMLK